MKQLTAARARPPLAAAVSVNQPEYTTAPCLADKTYFHRKARQEHKGRIFAFFASWR